MYRSETGVRMNGTEPALAINRTATEGLHVQQQQQLAVE